ncbi:MAG: hypothetical protein MUF34_11640 [Polyangiaceae bacterium]|jgi:hypothetical protein|nr:hypothetical protein [Polyangiaceae bacterium]
MLRRELGVVLGARATWAVAALAALLVGHGFVLALDLYAATSRSALGETLMRRELDPLAGLVRPTLGGLYVAVALLAPVLCVRPLALEKERRSFGALALAAGDTWPLVLAAWLAALAGASLLLAPPVALLLMARALGAHVDAPETAVAFAGHALHLALVATIATASAAWTRSSAQATGLALAASLGSWALDAGDEFAALAWLRALEGLSIARQLAPFERGIVPLGPAAWLLVATAGMLALSALGASFARPRQKVFGAVAGALLLAAGLSAAGAVRRAYDWSEERRASLPPAAVEALRALALPLRVEVLYDRDDARRWQLERDVLAKLQLARPDADIVAPLDARSGARVAEREAGYGRLVLYVGDVTRETTSTSRREVTTLLFEAAGRPLPDWSQAPYPGYPWVAEGWRRTALFGLAYVGLPGVLVALGLLLTRERS